MRQLSALVSVRSRFNRSVHLERDLAQNNADNYHLTLSSHEALSDVSMAWSRPSERAMTLIGPYGAGKSAFAVFLARVLDGDQKARQALRQRDETLHREMTQEGEMLAVSLVGSRAPLAPSLVSTLSQTLQKSAPKAWAKIEATQRGVLQQNVHTPRQIADLFLVAAQAVSQRGLVLLIDEMGKFLEYAAAHPQDGDILVLQELAEAAARSGDNPLWVIGILHQNAEAYAQRLSRAQQGEWLKVSQRFRQIALFPSDVERMDMVGLALQHAPALHLNGHVEELAQQCLEFAPAGSSTRFADIARAAYPLHPLALLALPPLFSRAGQSHRSVFNFLNSEESGALGRFVRESVFDEELPPFFPLDTLFDYARDVLLSGWQGANSRVWAEAVESVERAQSLSPELSPQEIVALKIIGLLSWIHDARLKPSKRVLELALHGAAFGDDTKPEDAATILSRLAARRLVVWSRARDAYRLWEGGDIDIEAEMTAARSEISGDSMLAFNDAPLAAGVLSARRHSFQTGTLRLARIVALRPNELTAWCRKNDSELAVVLCLANTQQDADNARELAIANKSANFLFAVALESDTLREAALDLAAAAHVAVHVPNLEGDRAARRELELRRGEAETIFQAERGRLFGVAVGGNNGNKDHCGGTAAWFYGGASVQFSSARSFSAFLSDMADATFNQTPHLRNELLNRRQLSSAGASARRALVTAMISNGAQERLGIKGFPPEYSMYESLLRAGGLHRENPDECGSWSWHAPNAQNDSINLLPSWHEIEATIFASPPREVPLVELFARLNRAPFGVSEGVLPVLLCAFLRVHERETTLYKDGVFLPEARAADWEVLLRRPDLFAVAGCRVEGARREIVGRLARSLNEEDAVVPLVRRLLKMTRALPEHAWKTRRLSPRVLRLRESIERARSPERLLFEEMPRALDLEPFVESVARLDQTPDGKTQNVQTSNGSQNIRSHSDDETAATSTENFFARLNECLNEWNNITPQTLQRARGEFLCACGLPENDAGWQQLRGLRTKNDNAKGAIHPQLLALLNRLEGSDEAALESVLSLVSQRSPRAWSDADVDNFSALAAPFGAMIKELRRDAPREESAPHNDTTSSTRLNAANARLQPAERKLALSASRKLRKHLTDSLGVPLAPHIQRAALLELLASLEK